MKNKIRTVAVFLAAMFLVTEMVAAQVPTANISGMKFNDLNDNGIKDAGEPGLANWTITLLAEGDEFPATTLTDSDGNYTFTGLAPGNYTVGEVVQSDWVQTLPVAPGTYTVELNGVDVTAKDFGNFNWTVRIMHPDDVTLAKWLKEYDEAPNWTPPPIIKGPMVLSPGGSKSLLSHIDYNAADRNQGSCPNCWMWAGTGAMEVAHDVKNSVFDRLSIQYMNSNYDNGIACHLGSIGAFTGFYNKAPKFAIPWSNTNANWQDGNLDDGDPTNVPANTISTTPHYNINSIGYKKIQTQNVGQATAIANIKASIDNNIPVYFAFFLPDSNAWTDFRKFWWNNGENTPLWNPDNYNGQTWGQGSGGHAVLLVGYSDTDPIADNHYWLILNSWGTAGNNRPSGLFRMRMNINYDDTLVDAGNSFYSLEFENLDPMDFAKTGSISGMKFNDLNSNGINDGEPGLDGWTITLTGPSGTISTVTSGGGIYKFDGLASGTYTVGEVLKAGWKQTAPTPVSPGTYTVTITAAGEDVTGKDFGNFQLGSISGMKFNDLNRNGINDGEPGLDGWTITLTGPSGTMNTVTSGGGKYKFDGLAPGTYTIGEVLLPGWKQTAPAGGTYTVTLSSGENVKDKDFGNKKFSIFGMKFNDKNGNKKRDPGEEGLAGWHIRLVGVDTLTRTPVNKEEITDANGNYGFVDVTPGIYQVFEVIDVSKAGWVPTTPPTVPITNLKAIEGVNVNFGNRKIP